MFDPHDPMHDPYALLDRICTWMQEHPDREKTGFGELAEQINADLNLHFPLPLMLMPYIFAAIAKSEGATNLVFGIEPEDRSN